MEKLFSFHKKSTLRGMHAKETSRKKDGQPQVWYLPQISTDLFNSQWGARISVQTERKSLKSNFRLSIVPKMAYTEQEQHSRITECFSWWYSLDRVLSHAIPNSLLFVRANHARSTTGPVQKWVQKTISVSGFAFLRPRPDGRSSGPQSLLWIELFSNELGFGPFAFTNRINLWRFNRVGNPKGTKPRRKQHFQKNKSQIIYGRLSSKIGYSWEPHRLTSQLQSSFSVPIISIQYQFRQTLESSRAQAIRQSLKRPELV